MEEDVELPSETTPPPPEDPTKEPIPRTLKTSLYDGYDFEHRFHIPKIGPVKTYRAILCPPADSEIRDMIRVAKECYGTKYGRRDWSPDRQKWHGLLWSLRIYTLWVTAARISEACALKVSDFDLEHGTVLITKALTPSGIPKNCSVGQLPLSKKSIDFFKQAFEDLKLESDDYLFSGRKKPVTPDTIRRGLKPIVRLVGLSEKNVFPHLLRVKTCTSLIDKVGIDLASKFLRHKSKQVTIQSYWRHTSDESRAKTQQAIDEMVSDMG